MKKTFAALWGSFAILFFVSFGVAPAQETMPSPAPAGFGEVSEDDLPKPDIDSADADNPGMPWLDQATEEKLRAASAADLGKVIALCRKARKEGLMGENLEYCKQLMAATQIQRSLVFSRFLLERNLPKDWAGHRDRILAELEEAVTVIKDQPLPFLRIAQLNILPDGDTRRAAEALDTAGRLSRNEPGLYAKVVELRLELEKDPVKQEAILAAAVGESNNNALILQSYAEVLFRSDKVDKALEVLEKIIENNPENIKLLENVYENAYQFLLVRGESDQAMKILEILEKNGVAEDEIAMRKVQLFDRTGKYAEAVSLLDELRKKHPDNPEILFQRSGLFLLMEKFDEANKDVEAALRLRPNTPRYIARKIQVFTAQKKFDEAVAAARELRSEDPGNIEFTLLETQIYIAQKEYDKAANLVRELAEKNAGEPKWQELLVQILVECERYDLAAETVEKYRQDRPERKDLVPLLIVLLIQKKQFDKAEPILEKYLKEKPEEEKRILLQAQFYIEKQDYARATEILERFREKHRDDQGLTVQLVALYSQQKKNRKAWEYLKPLLEKEPENVGLLKLKSQIMIAINRHSEAVKALEAVLKVEPDDEVSLNNLSWLLSTSPNDLIRNGKKALDLALKACQVSEYKKAYILSTLAAAYAENGDFGKAIEWSQKCLEISKDDESVKDQIEDLKKELESYKNKKPYREVLEETETE